MLIKWRNRHNTCLRADRGALAQMHWPSFKAAQQRDVRRQVLPNRLIFVETGGIQKAPQPHRATRQGNPHSLRCAARLANFSNAMTVVPLDQHCLKVVRIPHVSRSKSQLIEIRWWLTTTAINAFRQSSTHGCHYASVAKSTARVRGKSRTNRVGKLQRHASRWLASMP